MERKRVLVAFGDIRGFRKWTIRAMNAPEIAGTLIKGVYELFEAFSHRTGYYVKYLGDGILIVKELGPGHNCGTARRFMHDVHELAEAVSEKLKGVYPRPDGFRIRETCGHVWKRYSLLWVRGRPMRCAEYIGYAINMAQALLSAYPEILHICHEANLELIGQKKNGFSSEHLSPPNERRHGVDPQDFAGLFRIWIERKNNDAA